MVSNAQCLQIKWMERNVLNYVKFDISTPTVEFFATYFSHLMGVSSKVQSLMWCVVDGRCPL